MYGSASLSALMVTLVQAKIRTFTLAEVASIPEYVLGEKEKERKNIVQHTRYYFAYCRYVTSVMCPAGTPW